MLQIATKCRHKTPFSRFSLLNLRQSPLWPQVDDASATFVTASRFLWRRLWLWCVAHLWLQSAQCACNVFQATRHITTLSLLLALGHYISFSPGSWRSLPRTTSTGSRRTPPRSTTRSTSRSSTAQSLRNTTSLGAPWARTWRRCVRETFFIIINEIIIIISV